MKFMLNIVSIFNLPIQTLNFSILSPLEQFEILHSFIFITNSNIFLCFAIIVTLIFYQSYKQNLLWLPKKTQTWAHLLEVLNDQLILLIVQNLGIKVGQMYYTWILFCFMIIVSINLIGIVPYAFTVTSHIIVTFSLSFILFIGINIRAILDKKYSFFQLFLPSGAPGIITPFLIIIELISYIARVFSLAIRLFANIMAGHTLLKILIGFAFLILFQLPTTNWLISLVGIIPFLLVIIITFLEVAIAILQAYVFTVLICLYIKDLYTAH